MNSKTAFLASAKAVTFALGFIGALALVQWITGPFPSRRLGAYTNLPAYLGPGLSAFLFAACMAGFAFSVWNTTPLIRHPFRRADYSLLALICGVGFAAGAFTLLNAHAPAITGAQLLFFPASAYTLAMLAFGELVARLRDKNLLPTLYWPRFFKAYPVYRPVGFLALLLLASQLFLLVGYFFSPIRLFALFAICALTYFAAFLLNLSAEYDKANAAKLRAERFKSELITNVSHDIKTPLTSIINYVDLLKKTDLQGQSAEYVQILDKKAARLKTLIHDLMEASKAGTGNVRVDAQEINFGEIIGQAAGEFEDSFAANGLTLVIRQPHTPVWALADSRLLYRALENLFSNAAKYALGGTRVFAEFCQVGGRTRFTLQNTAQSPMEISGAGLTEQFIRGDKARQTEGSGLGLYIAKSLVELMGGTLTINIIGDLFQVEVLL